MTEGTTLHLQSQNLGGNTFISEKHEFFDGLLHDYDPNMSCIFVPAEHRERELTEFCYAIVEHQPQRPPQVLRWLTPQMLDDPKSIMMWLWQGDIRRQGKTTILERLDAEMKFEEAIKLKREAEEREERIDLVTNIVKGGRDRKNYYRHDGVTYR